MTGCAVLAVFVGALIIGLIVGLGAVPITPRILKETGSSGNRQVDDHTAPVTSVLNQKKDVDNEASCPLLTVYRKCDIVADDLSKID